MSNQIIDPPHLKRKYEDFATAAEDALETLKLIDKLRDGEGDTLLIHSDNADFNSLPNCSISINAWWTKFTEIVFAGDTLLECLRAAAKAQYEAPEWNGEAK